MKIDAGKQISQKCNEKTHNSVMKLVKSDPFSVQHTFKSCLYSPTSRLLSSNSLCWNQISVNLVVATYYRNNDIFCRKKKKKAYELVLLHCTNPCLEWGKTVKGFNCFYLAFPHLSHSYQNNCILIASCTFLKQCMTLLKGVRWGAPPSVLYID